MGIRPAHFNRLVLMECTVWERETSGKKKWSVRERQSGTKEECGVYLGCSVLWRRLFTCSQGTKLGTIDVFQFLFQTHALVHLQAHTLFDSHSYKRAHTHIYIVIHAHKCASTQPSSPLRSYHVHFSTLTLAHMLSERLLYSQQTPKQFLVCVSTTLQETWPRITYQRSNLM